MSRLPVHKLLGPYAYCVAKRRPEVNGMPGITMDIDDYFADDEDFKEKAAYYLDRLERLVVPAQISEGAIKTLNAELDALFTEAAFDYAACESDYLDIQRKIEIVRKTVIDGSNEQARVAAGYLAARSFEEEDGTTVNLFVLESVFMRRFKFMQAVVNVIANKSGNLLSDVGVLKIEGQVAGR